MNESIHSHVSCHDQLESAVQRTDTYRYVLVPRYMSAASTTAVAVSCSAAIIYDLNIYRVNVRVRSRAHNSQPSQRTLQLSVVTVP